MNNKYNIITIVLIILIILTLGLLIYNNNNNNSFNNENNNENNNNNNINIIDNNQNQEIQEYSRYNYSLSNTNLTNQDVILTFNNTNNKFISIKDPNNIESNNYSYTYTITSNGEYTFIVTYSDKVDSFTVTITNIDKDIPTGTCNIDINGDKSTYTINANDTNGIKYYLVNDNNNVYNTNTINIDKKVTNYDVTIYDNADNSNTITCTKTITNSPINKTSSSNILYEYYSDTLKYWVETKDKYHITHIWVKDATKQINTWLYNDVGGTSNKSVKHLANNLIATKNLYNKGLVISNGSAFTSTTFSSYLWDGSATNKQSKSSWKYYPQTPLIISQGTVRKDFTNSVLPSYTKNQTTFDKLVYVFSSDSWLRSYSYTINDVTKNQATTKTIMDSNPIFTLAFKPVLVSNYKAKTSTGSSYTEQKKRNAICQIDENNFILMNTIGAKADSTYSKYIASWNEMATYFVNLGCKNAFNLDGGGSVTEYTKDNTNNLKTVVIGENISNGGRYVGDAFYFVEQ